MKRLIAVLLAASWLLCGLAIAQDTMKQDNTMQADSGTKAVKVMGKINKDGKTWTIKNPEAVKGHEGHHVVLTAHVYADKGEVHVMSLKMAHDNMKKNSM